MSPLALYLALASWSALTPRGPVATMFSADLDGDGIDDHIAFHKAADDTRGFLHVTSDLGPLRTEPRTSPIYPAWKAVAGHLDASRADRIVLGVWTTKNTRAGEPPKKSVWVVALDGPRFRELWRGSALARPFDDFMVADLDQDGIDELVVRECSDPKAQGFTAYRWSGFGFGGLARLGSPCDAGRVAWPRLRLSGGRLWLDDS